MDAFIGKGHTELDTALMYVLLCSWHAKPHLKSLGMQVATPKRLLGAIQEVNNVQQR